MHFREGGMKIADCGCSSILQSEHSRRIESGSSIKPVCIFHTRLVDNELIVYGHDGDLTFLWYLRIPFHSLSQPHLAPQCPIDKSEVYCDSYGMKVMLLDLQLY